MTLAVLSPSFPGDRAATQRIALALAISALAHLFLVQNAVFDAPRQAGQPLRARTITVRIMAPAPPLATMSEVLIAPQAGTDATGADSGQPVAPATSRMHPKQDLVTPPVLPQAPDPTYYAARDLDVYPRPSMPLDFDRLVSRSTDVAVGQFRVVILIDEGGAVNEIAVVEPEAPGRLQEALRAALAGIRFFPGQKAGRAVKSRVLLSVSLDPAGAGR